MHDRQRQLTGSSDRASSCSAALKSTGLFIADDFLSLAETALLHEDLLLRRSELRPARLGKEKLSHSKVRGDHTLWWDLNAELSPAQTILRTRLEELRTELNSSLYLGLEDWEGHYALYPPGSGYARHLDRFKDDDRRTVSCIVYLNLEWMQEFGGELLAEPKDQPPVRVSPMPGRAVFFLSAEVPHAVLPSTRERFSFAGWFRRRA